MRSGSDITTPTALMCGRSAPCRPHAFMSDHARYFPLTRAEEERLLGMYPAQWTPAASLR
jgi:hypothetical protein